MLPTIRLATRPTARPTSRRRPVLDVVLGVSRRRRQAGYFAIVSGLNLLRPMLRRVGGAVAVLAAVAFVSAYVRFVF